MCVCEPRCSFAITRRANLPLAIQWAVGPTASTDLRFPMVSPSRVDQRELEGTGEHELNADNLKEISVLDQQERHSLR